MSINFKEIKAASDKRKSDSIWTSKETNLELAQSAIDNEVSISELIKYLNSQSDDGKCRYEGKIANYNGLYEAHAELTGS